MIIYVLLQYLRPTLHNKTQLNTPIIYLTRVIADRCLIYSGL